ncbi:MAG: hypothetical protein K9N10_08055 [Deltaproteobacteria bacterium]|nr:hypothetical protein [Deltaproteobacteria bacterium]
MDCSPIVTKSYFLRFILFIAAAFLALFLNACSVKLVQPHDEKLMAGTEAFYKKGAEMIMAGQSLSPKSDEDRDAITNPHQNPAHFSQFESKYNHLIIDSEALILRAMSSSQKIDSAGQAIQAEIDRLIEATVPSNCPQLQSEFGKLSLTVQNFVDLKCLILKWKEQHRDSKKGILKKANWEARKITLFNIIFAIQKAESFKAEKAEK